MEFTDDRPVRIIGTGSSGNCSVIDGQFIIDLGVRKAQIPDELMKQVSAVLVTHRHVDHLLVPTLKWVYDVRPDLVTRQLFMVRDAYEYLAERCDERAAELAAKIPAANILDEHSEFSFRTRRGKYDVTCFECVHDVQNVGFDITAPDGRRIVWATDTSSLEFAPDGLFDIVCVEGNYDEVVLKAALDDPVLFTRSESNLRHLSVQDMETYARRHSKDGAIVVQLHMSHDFGIRSKMNTFTEAELGLEA